MSATGRPPFSPPCAVAASPFSRTSSAVSEVPAGSGATSSTSSLTTAHWFTPSSTQCSGPRAPAAPPEVAAAVPPLVGLQRLAGNAFSLREVTAPWGAGPAVKAASPPHASAAPPALTAASPSVAWITPDTSPRAGWPGVVAAAPSASTPRTRPSGSGRPRRERRGPPVSQPPRGSGVVVLSPPTFFSSSVNVAQPGIPGEELVTAPHGAVARTASFDASTPFSPLMPSIPQSAYNASLSLSGPGAAAPFRAAHSAMQTPHHRHRVLGGGGGQPTAWRSAGQLPLSPFANASASVLTPHALSAAPAPPLQAPAPLLPTSLAAAMAAAPLVDGGLLPFAPDALLALYQPTATAPPPPPAPPEALRDLFQRYLAAQRAHGAAAPDQPSPPYSGVGMQPHVPLELQERVLRYVGDFATQLAFAASATQPHYTAPPALHPCASVLPLNGDGWYASAKTLAGHPTRADQTTHQLLPHRGAAVPWDVVFGYLAGPPVAAHTTLRAVCPASRRRLEQLGWRWMVREVARHVCPFIVESDMAGHVRDAFARLDGQERQYTGSVAVARRSPLPLPAPAPSSSSTMQHTTCTPNPERLLDGGALLDCERQSLLLDRAWREGWLHRLRRSHHSFLLPRLSGRPATSSRIRVDGVVCDRLRPRRVRHETCGAGAVNGSAVGASCGDARGAFTAAGGAGDADSNTVHRAGLTPPPPPMLDRRPTEALSATRKLLGDAVSAISRERARSADASLSSQLHGRFSGSAAARVAALETASATSTAPAGIAAAAPGLDVSVSSASGLDWTRAAPAAGPTAEADPRHPYLGLASVPALVEDVSGTVHLLCTSQTEMDGPVVRAWVSGWLAHRHRPPRQPLCTTAAEFLLGRPPVRGGGVVDEEDYAVCVTTATAPGESRDAGINTTLRQPLMRLFEPSSVPGSEWGAGELGTAMPELVFHQSPMRKPVHPVDVGHHSSATGTGDGCDDGLRVRLQEWRRKRGGVVRRMNDVDPPWMMLGNATGPLPRALALHLTEQHIPWLARQLCPDSESGGLVDLQEVHLCVTESLLPVGWDAAWRWCCSVLRARKNLLVVSITTQTTVSAALPAAEASGSTEGGGGRAAAPITGLLAESTVVALMATAPLQVLSLQGTAPEAVVPLFRGTNAPAAPALARLRELYVAVRRGAGAGGSPRTAGLTEYHVDAAVFPSLQVLWLDAPRVRHVRLDQPLVLRELHLVADASLSCSALRGVEQLAHLEVLHIEKAVIDDCAFLGECVALRELLLHACRLSPTLLLPSASSAVEELRGVELAPRLTTLSLCYTEEVKNLQNFARCRSLRRLLLTRCNGIRSPSLSGLERLPQLELLAVEYTRVSGLSHFAAAPALRVLRADGCKRVLRSSVMGLESAALLTELSLQDTNVSTVANFGGGCVALRSLDLSGCRHLDVDGLQGIQALPQLEVLSLSHTPISDVTFLSDCVRLTSLYLEGCTALQPAALQGLRHAPRLRKVIANGCPTLTTVGGLGSCAALEVLSLAGSTALTADGVQGVESSRRLQYLDLSATSVHSLHFLARGCRALRCLAVRACRHLTSLHALHGLETLPRLDTLNMDGLDVRGSLSFLMTSPSLRHVSCVGCTGLTEEDVRVLRASRIFVALS